MLYFENFDAAVQGILICYGPLAVMIIGFIGFAWITDGDARRRYLRRIDMRTEDEAPPVLPPVVTKRITAETPAGPRVTIDPDATTVSVLSGRGKAPSPRITTISQTAAPVAVPTVAQDVTSEDTDTTDAQLAEAAEAAAAGEPDDLKVVEGIGPKMEQALNAAGITTYAQLAAASDADLLSAVEAAGMRLAPSLSTWSEQANFAANGDWDGLKALQSNLVGGRRVDTDDDSENDSENE